MDCANSALIELIERFCQWLKQEESRLSSPASVSELTANEQTDIYYGNHPLL